MSKEECAEMLAEMFKSEKEFKEIKKEAINEKNKKIHL
jgi:hypothetical protein